MRCRSVEKRAAEQCLNERRPNSEVRLLAQGVFGQAGADVLVVAFLDVILECIQGAAVCYGPYIRRAA